MSVEIKQLIEDQGRAWAEFRQANDARLAALESKNYAPADLEAKVDAINADLTAISKSLAQAMADMQRRSMTGGHGGLTPEQQEHRSAFQRFLRTGRDDGVDLRGLERKAMSVQSDPDGGYLVDVEMDAAIDRVAVDMIGLASVCRSVMVGSVAYQKLVKTSSSVGSAWIDSDEEPGETSTPTWASITIPTSKVASEPRIPNDLLEDAEYDLEADIYSEVGLEFGLAENQAFVDGNGVKKPRGVLSYPLVANSSYAWGSIGYIKSGANGDFASSNPANKIIDLQHALRPAHRPGSVWVMGDDVLAKVRQIQDGSSNYYLWNPDPTAGPNGNILGSPVVVDEHMPALGTGSYSMLYGNFQRAYTVTRRRGVAVIVDRITKKGTTKYHFTRRTGGGVTHFEAVKAMRFAS